MPAVFTIGFRQKALREFVRRLREASVDGIIDIRLRNTSQLAGWTKRDDFEYLLREGFGIEYEHRQEQAPSQDIMDRYRVDKDWAAYEKAFGRLMIERDAIRAGRDILSRYRAPCLLCAEPSADQCHRRLVAAHWAEHLPDVTVVHL
jgi:uncharacterized protein (DUF488 family)